MGNVTSPKTVYYIVKEKNQVLAIPQKYKLYNVKPFTTNHDRAKINKHVFSGTPINASLLEYFRYFNVEGSFTRCFNRAPFAKPLKEDVNVALSSLFSI